MGILAQVVDHHGEEVSGIISSTNHKSLKFLDDIIVCVGKFLAIVHFFINQCLNDICAVLAFGQSCYLLGPVLDDSHGGLPQQAKIFFALPYLVG